MFLRYNLSHQVLALPFQCYVDSYKDLSFLVILSYRKVYFLISQTKAKELGLHYFLLVSCEVSESINAAKEMKFLINKFN